jgi:hypothetical protein
MTRELTDEDVEKIEERDGLAYRKLRGEELSPEEHTRLDELNEWLDSIWERPRGLDDETLALMEQVQEKLRRD